MERCSICQKEINRYVGATWLKLGKKDIKICHICNMNLGILQSANEAGTNPDPSVVEYFESIKNISLDPELSAYFRPYLDKEERERLAQEEAERKELEQKMCIRDRKGNQHRTDHGSGAHTGKTGS